MQRVTFFVFFLGVIVLSVNCASELDDYMDTFIEKTNKMVTEYNKNLDKAVPVKELRESLKALNLMAKDYHGSSQDPIYKATNLGYQATDKYYEATDEIFSWCVKAEFIISYIIDSEPDKRLAYKAIMKLVTNGLATIKASLAKLNEVRHSLTAMVEKLSPVPKAVTKELEELRHQQYNKQVELRQRHEELMRKREELKWNIVTALSLLGAVATLVLGYLTGPVGLALGLGGNIAAAGVPLAVLQGKVEPSQDDKWKITEGYYKSLIAALGHAEGNITAVQKSIGVEISEVQSLKGCVEGELEVLTMYEENQVLSPQLVNKLSEFKNSLKNFISRHRGGYTNRRRREILSECHGLDVESVSYAVDTFLNSTAVQRQEAFWILPTLPVNANHFIGDLKFSLI